MTEEATKLKTVARVVPIGLLSSSDAVTLRTLATFTGDILIAVNPTELIPLASVIAEAAASKSTGEKDYKATSSYKSYCMQGTLCFVNPSGRLLNAVRDIVESPGRSDGAVGTGIIIILSRLC